MLLNYGKEGLQKHEANRVTGNLTGHRKWAKERKGLHLPVSSSLPSIYLSLTLINDVMYTSNPLVRVEHSHDLMINPKTRDIPFFPGRNRTSYLPWTCWG